MNKFTALYNRHYKKILFFPALLLLLSLSFLVFFYNQTGDIMYKDVSLTGGTTISIFSDIDHRSLEAKLSKELSNLEVRSLLDNTGKQSQIVVIVSEEKQDLAIELIQQFLGYELNSENSSIETTSSSLSGNFYKQLLASIALAFFWMAAVVFLIFSRGLWLKTLVIILNIIFGVLLGKSVIGSGFNINILLLWVIGIFLISLYIRKSVPSFAIVLSAFSDIVMTLAVVNLIGMRLSTAGIVAFLMMIGYSVDTDILLTTRVLQKKESVNKELFSAFKTGMTMTLTSIAAVAVALVVVYNFGSVLNQIFTILLIGLFFDIINTWFANASIIKWYVEKQ